MEKEERDALRAKFLAAINKVMKSSKSESTQKSEKIIDKFVKKIVKTICKEEEIISS